MLRLLLAFVLLPGLSRAQPPLLRHYTTQDGLPSNVIYNIYQDRNGFVWFCTDGGISRFDGQHFQNYSINEGLPDNEVLNLAEDSFGRYWVACYNREPCYLKAGRVYTRANDALCRQVGALGLEYTALFRDRDGVVCLAGRRIGGIYRDRVVRRYAEMPTGSLVLSSQSFGAYNYFFLASGNLIIQHGRAVRTVPLRNENSYVSFSQGNRLFLVDDSRGRQTLYQYTLRADSVILDAAIPFPAYGYSILTGSDTSVLCLTATGIYAYSIPGRRLYRPAGLPTDLPANRLLQDRDGHTWLGTLNDGVFLQGHEAAAATVYNAAAGLPDENVLSLNPQPGGAVSAGFSGGFSLLRGGRAVTVPLAVQGKLNRILFVHQLPDGAFLAGSDRGLYRIDPAGRYKHTLSKQAQKACFRDGPYCYVAHSAGAFRYDSRTQAVASLWRGRTTAIATDGAGRVWLGGLQGLWCIDAGVVKRFDRTTALSTGRITSMDRLPDGRLAVATHRNGLYVWNGRALCHLTAAGGLRSDHCSKVVADSGNRLWLSTDRGLDRITLPPDGPPTVYRYGGADGLPADKINDVAVCGARLYVATPRGVVVLPKDAARPPTSPPPVYIVSVATRDTTVYFPDGALRLSYPQNALQLAYTGISFGTGGLEYRYVLDGGSPDTVVTALGTLNLSAVKPGRYRLLLWARADGGAWSPAPAVFAFSVLPPFWLTGWFLAGAGAVLVLSGSALYRRKVRLVRRSAREKGAQRQRMAELELQALRAQINPHFLFNALNSIQHFYSQNDERKANHYLSLFAQLIRRTLHHSKRQLLPLAEEIDLLATYVELEQMRFKHAFSYAVEIERGINPQEVKIPAMLLQPYVENAIQHGLRPLTGRPGHLRIAFDRVDGALLCRVDDNGIGLEQAKQTRRNGHQSLGMEINRQRIETLNLLFKIHIDVTIVDKTATGGHGTCVSLTLPAYHDLPLHPHR